MNKLYVMLPCYNESENIEDLINDWLKTGEKLKGEYEYTIEIYGIDDGSSDDTRDIIRDMESRFDNVHLIAHKVNKGLGGVLDTAFKYFNDASGENDLCVLMDGDNSHLPKYIFSMIDKMRNSSAGCVIASRYCDVSDVHGLSKVRVFLSDGAKVFYSLFLRVPKVKDYTCGYRLYSHQALKKLYDVYGEHAVENSSFACMMEVLYKLHKVGVEFEEVPFELRYDLKKGDSKMNVFKTIKNSVVTTLKLRFGKN